ncbi:MAG: restriction endonuclease subunit S [Oscillospiraceae bacterium]|nr:restriction endonuclease subunit S [Oscillospiraceae bacterium]
MDGLEISEIQLSDLERTARIDAEFYKKENLAIAALIKKAEFCPVTDYFTISDGNHMSISEEFQTEGVPYYRGQDIYNTFIEEASPVCIDEDTFSHPHMIRSHLRAGDVLMSIVGAIVGNSAIVSSDAAATCSCKLAIIRPKNNGVLPEYLLIYIKTKYGQNQIQKFKRGAAQTGFLLEDFDQICLPQISPHLQYEIRRVVNRSREAIVCANQKCKQAENIVLSAVGYHDIEDGPLTASVRSLKSSFLSSGRLDAEFYQAKYDEYLKLIQRYKGGYSYVGTEFDQVLKMCDRTHSDYPYVEIGDVNVHSGIATYNVISTELLPANAKIMTKRGDILVSTVRPNRGAVAILDSDSLLVSGAFTVIRQKGHYKKETLQTLLRTKLYRDWLLRYNVGTSYPVIKDEDVLGMPIPLFELKIHDDIEAKMQESFSLRRKSKELLEYAKQAVEMVIEHGEEAALEWLHDKV